MFRVAVSGRREQEASFFTVIVWRDQADHAAESLSKGSWVVVVGVRRRAGPEPAVGNGDTDQGGQISLRGPCGIDHRLPADTKQ